MLRCAKPSNREVERLAKEIKTKGTGARNAAVEAQGTPEKGSSTPETSDLVITQKLEVFKARLGQFDTIATDPEVATDPQTELKARIDLTRKQLELTEEATGESSEDVLSVLGDLGVLLNQAGLFDESQSVYARQQKLIEDVRVTAAGAPLALDRCTTSCSLSADRHCVPRLADQRPREHRGGSSSEQSGCAASLRGKVWRGHEALPPRPRGLQTARECAGHAAAGR